jgi:ATP-dependent DNA helicase RecQ
MPIGRVIKQMEMLAKRGIATYIPRYKGTTVVLLTERLPENHLTIPHELLELRVKNKKIRAEAMVKLIANDQECRMQQLVQYFDEKTNKNCGICDSCASENTAQVKQIIYANSAGTGISLQNVALLLPHIPGAKLKKAIEELFDAEMIKRTPNGRFVRD